MVGGEIDPDTGCPCYRRVVVYVPRQNGKTTLILTWEVQRTCGWAVLLGPQRVVYTAQTGNDAAKKLVRDQFPILSKLRKPLGITAMLRGNGGVAVQFANGSSIEPIPTTPDAGHGMVVDLGVIDELFADPDDRRQQALVPAMKTRASAQLLICSTAGTDASGPLNRLVARGRNSVEKGAAEGVAYFEWSAPLDADPDDPATWWACNPAMGHTMTEATLRDDRENLPDGEFRRADLNQPTMAEDRVIPLASWDAVCLPDVAVGLHPVFALDMSAERDAGAIAAASGGTIPSGEVIDHRPGVGWLVEACRRLSERYSNSVVALDAQGPASALIPELEEAGVRVEKLGARDVLGACGAFFDRVIEGRVRIRRHLALDEAAAGAVRRQSGDAWAWARRSSVVDISTLNAVTFATWCASRPLRSVDVTKNVW